MRYIMGDLLEQLAKRHLDAQLLQKFAHEACLEGLTCLALATGELPQAGQVGANRTLGDQKFLLVKNQAGGNVDGLTGQCTCR